MAESHAPGDLARAARLAQQDGWRRMECYAIWPGLLAAFGRVAFWFACFCTRPNVGPRSKTNNLNLTKFLEPEHAQA